MINSLYFSENYNNINDILYTNDFSLENENRTDSNKTLFEKLKDKYGGIIGNLKNLTEHYFKSDNTSEEYYKCINYFKKLEEGKNETILINTFKSMFYFSDMSLLPDPNSEIHCIEDKETKDLGLTYILFVFHLNSSLTNNETKYSKDMDNIQKFFENSAQFSTGICIPKVCEKLITKNFERKTPYIDGLIEYRLKKNTVLYDSLENDVKDFSYLTKTEVFIEDGKQFSTSYGLFIISCIFFGLVFFIRICFTIYFKIKIYKGNKFYKQNVISDNDINNVSVDDDDEDSDDEDDNIDQNKKKENTEEQAKEKIFSQAFQKNSEKKEIQNYEKKLYEYYLNCSSFMKSVKILNEDESNYYNSKNLQIPYMFQTICLFFMVFNQSFYILNKYPSKEYFDISNYSPRRLAVNKLATYSTCCFLSINGFIACFKTMTFIKKYIIKAKLNVNKEYKILNTVLVFIPKILMFLLSFFIVNRFTINLFSLSEATGQKKEISYFVEKKCQLSPIKYIFPFIFEFKNFGEVSKNECSLYVYAYENEFIVFLFFILILFICYKFKNKYVDLGIFITLIINFCITFLSFMKVFKETKYRYKELLGEMFTIKYFHLYFSIYFIGVFGGLIHFYNTDIITENSLMKRVKIKDENEPGDSNKYYIPFQFLDVLREKIYGLSQVIKVLLIILCIGLIVLFANIRRFYIKNEDSELTLDFTKFLKFIYFYENLIVSFLCIFLLVLFCSFSSDSTTMKLSSLKFFNLTGRLSFFSFSILKVVCHSYNIITDYESSLNIVDLFLISFGSFLFTLLISFAFVVLIEVPLRYLIKEIRVKACNLEVSNGFKLLKQNQQINEENEYHAPKIKKQNDPNDIHSLNFLGKI